VPARRASSAHLATAADVLRAAAWQPSTSLVRAALGSLALAVTAVVTGRPDLLVLATPLLVHAVCAVVRRPAAPPQVSSRLGHGTLREGEGTTLEVQVAGAEAAEHAVLAVTLRRWLAVRPAGGVIGAAVPTDESTAALSLPVASLRWGHRGIGDGLVGVRSQWAGYEWGPVATTSQPLTTLPLPGRFDSRAASPHPIGLVGTNPARRPGEGTEFASIRPFQPGDRLRRVQWRVSLRTGALHVTSTVAEEDASVLLVVDSGVEVGVSGGVQGAASTLDVAVRAAGAVAEHYLIRGDRVGLRVLGSTGRSAVQTAAGRRHLRRVLETLAHVVPGEHPDTDLSRLRFQVSAGSIVIVFSAMLSRTSVVATTTLAARGLDVVVVDTLPADVQVGEDDRRRQLAWRMRLLERVELLERVQRAGIPVVAWRGPGTLDEVLRRLGRRAAMPTLARR
jgi:uncharacterized protein (DUF58 family)